MSKLSPIRIITHYFRPELIGSAPLQSNEPSSFAEAVLKLADDPHLRAELGRRGREFIEHYAKPLILSAFSSRLDALVAQR
jgi:hypothetical protein